MPHTAAGTHHQQTLTGLEFQVLAEHLQGGKAHERQCRRINLVLDARRMVNPVLTE